jgi:hypothetical protein
MMKAISLAVMLFLTIHSSSALADGPFGVEMGTPIESLKDCSLSDKPGWYKCETLPKTHSAFDFYVLQAHSRIGVCFVKAIGHDTQTNRHGHQLMMATENIAKQLQSVYGNYKHTDNLLPGSIWRDADDWMMSVKEKERFYSFLWEKSDSIPLKNNIKSIYVSASALNTSVGYVAVEYAFDNEKECDKALEEDEKGAF